MVDRDPIEGVWPVSRGEQYCDVGPVRLCYEDLGRPDDPAVLLIMGLGTQMIAWPDDFCAGLVARGFRVVRFDNRDVGRSTHLEGSPPPRLLELVTRRVPNPAYTLADMAADAVGVLDHLGIRAAHVVGASMGGMIAQTVACKFPQRTLSLVSIMSTTGSLRVGQPRPRWLARLLRGVPTDRGRYVASMTKLMAAAGSPDGEPDLNELRDVLERSFDRGLSRSGFDRQLGAIIASGNRTRALQSVRCPALVIHGRDDPIVAPSGGRASARSIPGAHLIEFAGMGHDLPPRLRPAMVDAIAATAALGR